MMRILLATDGSEFGEAAVDEIALRHYPADSEVRVISVVETPHFLTMDPMGGFDMTIYDKIEKYALEVARAAVEKASAKLQGDEGSRQLNVTTKVIAGSPKEVILEEAEAFDTDLIVVGSHGHGVLERFLLGSVSQAVALHAKCSVEIVRDPKSGEKWRILLAIDGSEQSDAAVDEIAHGHSPPGSEVRVLSVVAPYFPRTLTPWEGADMRIYDQMEKEAREVARAAIEKAAAKLRAGEKNCELTFTTKVLSGSPKGVILEEAEAFGADLIVVGSHGHGMLERFLLGSVSHAVALHAKCSVEIVRGPKTLTSESE